MIALRDGYDVILEGILSVKSYDELMDEIFAEHPEESYMNYFNISFEETLKRHATRHIKSQEFGEKEMRAWYPIAHASGHRLERIIPESFSIEENSKFIKETSMF